MQTSEDRAASKRELIDAAVRTLGPARDASHRWAMRRAATHLALRVRDAQRVGQFSPDREELRVRLEDIRDKARSLALTIEGPGVSEAFQFGWAARDEDTHSPETFEALQHGPKVLQDAPNTLRVLEVVAASAIETLQLKGRRGNVGPWKQFHLPPKVLLARLGQSLFQEARGLSDPPGHNNRGFGDFLSLVWACATGEQNVLIGPRQLRPRD